MQISKTVKRVAAVVGLGALSVLGGETAEAALPIQGVGADMNVTVTVSGACTLATVPALAWTWDYSVPANNMDTGDLVIDCLGAPVPWEISNNGGGAVGADTTFTGGGANFVADDLVNSTWLGYTLTAPVNNGTGDTTVTLTAAADGTTSNGSATPSNGTYEDVVHINIHY